MPVSTHHGLMKPMDRGAPTMTENPEDYERTRDQDGDPTLTPDAEPQRRAEANPAVDDADRSGDSRADGSVE